MRGNENTSRKGRRRRKEQTTEGRKMGMKEEMEIEMKEGMVDG